jgi:hypothetical protein
LRFQQNPNLRHDQVKTVITVDKDNSRAHIFTNKMDNMMVLLRSQKVRADYRVKMRFEAPNVVEEIEGELELKDLEEVKSKLEGEITYE